MVAYCHFYFNTATIWDSEVIVETGIETCLLFMPRDSYIGHTVNQVVKAEARAYTSRIFLIFPWLVPEL